MFDHGVEGELGGGHSVGAGFARQMNRGGDANGDVLGVISPRLAGRIVLDFRGFKRDRRIAGSIQALRPFLADAQTPSGIVSGGEKKNWEVLGLRRRRSYRGRGRG